MKTCVPMHIITFTFIAVLSGCASAPRTKLMYAPPPATKAATTEPAAPIVQLAVAALSNDKASWASLARNHYDAAQYNEAITAAKEVLLRDPADKQANTIIAISGLHLSTGALSQLRRQKELKGEVRLKSDRLAKLLNKILGPGTRVPDDNSGDASHSMLLDWLNK